MAIEKRYTKDPEDELDYGWYWKQKWLPVDDYITASVWAVAFADSEEQLGVDDLTIDSSGFDVETGTTYVWLSQGVLNRKYIVTNTVSTFANRKKEKSFLLQIVSN
jgi:hypothetical protein